MKFNSGMEREQQEMNIFGFGFGCVFDGQFIGYGVHELFIQTLIHTVGDSNLLEPHNYEDSGSSVIIFSSIIKNKWVKVGKI